MSLIQGKLEEFVCLFVCSQINTYIKYVMQLLNYNKYISPVESMHPSNLTPRLIAQGLLFSNFNANWLSYCQVIEMCNKTLDH